MRAHLVCESQLNSLRFRHMQLIIAHSSIDRKSVFFLSLPLTTLFILFEQHEKPGQRSMDGQALLARMSSDLLTPFLSHYS